IALMLLLAPITRGAPTDVKRQAPARPSNDVAGLLADVEWRFGECRALCTRNVQEFSIRCVRSMRAGAPGRGSALRLRLRLALPPAGLVHLDRDRQRFHAAAVAGAAHRRRAEIVEPDGDA